MNYLHYDVFTGEPLLGNPLAVFPDARGLSTAQMQAIAREINFSETTFVLPAERADTNIGFGALRGGRLLLLALT